MKGGFFLGALGDLLEMTVDANVGILIETGVPFYTRFGLFSAFENTEVMDEETELPFVGFGRVVMLEGMCLTLGEFDEFTIRYASSRPMRRDMVSIEFEETFTETRRADDDMFATLPAFFDVVHRSPDAVDADTSTEIPHAFGVRRGVCRQIDESGNCSLQTRNYDIFKCRDIGCNVLYMCVLQVSNFNKV